MGLMRLHEKYGLNPTVVQCFWCGKDKNQIALLGAKYRGEAPHHMVLDYEPCEACGAEFAKGVVLMEGLKEPGQEPRPSGRYAVVSEAAVRAIFQPESTVEAILEHRRAFVEREAFERLFVRSADEQSDAVDSRGG